MKSYTTRDVAQLLNLRPAQVRSLARAGFLRPGRGPRNAYRFSFQDLVLLRAARALADARLPSRRIRRALRSLAQDLPTGRPLSGMRITAEGERVVVRDGAKTWHPESGQLLLDFSIGELARRAAPLARRLARDAQAQTRKLGPRDWFDLAEELEVVEPTEAIAAYERVLSLDWTDADAHVNLGRLLQERGEMAKAMDHYRAVLQQAPAHATAHYNLGTALEDTGRLGEAMSAYRHALRAEPDLADAHFNLSRLYEQTGQREAALRHLSRYKRLVEGEGRQVRGKG